MAEAIISAIVGDVASRVISLLVSHFNGSHAQSTEAKLQKLAFMLLRIHSVVEEAKGRHIKNDGTLQWLSELIEAENQARYLLDIIGCGEHKLEDEQGDKVLSRISIVSVFNPAKRVRVDACTMRKNDGFCIDDIDKITQKLQCLSSDLGEFIMLLQICEPIPRPLATNIFRKELMFGRHVEKERIINFLLNDCCSSSVELGVLPIVGNNGVGKTTLIQHVCEDARVRNHFQVIMFSNLTYTYMPATNEEMPNDPLQLLKASNFSDKRLLAVFEDIDMQKKDMLEGLLPDLRHGMKGSKVIITTNSCSVATIGTVEPITLKPLPLPEYWFLFKAYAFPGRDIGDNPKLVAVGNAIAKKLNRSFFGAKVVGGVLRDNPDPKYCCMVMRSNIGRLSSIWDGIAYISNLTETLLPGHLKICNVAVFKGSFPNQTTELARLLDESNASPHGGRLTGETDDVPFEEVLLCKSIFPFYNCYHIARCSLSTGSSNNSAKHGNLV